jgi:uncharacterized protein
MNYRTILFLDNYNLKAKVKKYKLQSIKMACLLMLAAFYFIPAFAQTNFNPDDLLKPRTGKQTLVNDFANILTPDQKQALENKLVTLDDSTSTQISVVIVPTVGSYNISDYNVELGRAWGVGGKQYNNGVVLLIAKEDRKLDIAVGYGLEGALPDVVSKSIIDDIIVPNFKGNDYYRGIDEGTDAIIRAVKGEYNVARKKSGGGGLPSGKIIVIIIIILFLLMSSGGNNKGGTFMSRRGARGLPGPIFWPMGGGGGGGGWGGGSSGGGGGGGFGGFGGGSFGGGGSSGSW